ncbi:MAG: preprotein translocase subunit SecA [Patescibacteria group bacterium]
MIRYLRKIFGDFDKRYIEKLRPVVDKINSLEKEFEELSGDKLKSKTKEFRKMIKQNSISDNRTEKTLENILPEAFALVREAAKRTLKQRHFDVQLRGGIVLHQGKIAEMKTGEGKTLAATLPLYLNALSGEGCHLVTVNDYLARRDTVWMGQIYNILGASVGCLNHEQSFLYDPQYVKPGEEKEKIRDEIGGFKIVQDFLRPCSRREAYLADITYGTNNEFGFDYLRDNMVPDKSQIVQRGFNFAIVDEVDFILIDESRTPLIISAPAEQATDKYYKFTEIMKSLKSGEDYEIDEKMKTSILTEKGQRKIIEKLGGFNPWEEGDVITTHHIDIALRVKDHFLRDRDYVVKDGEVIIVDEFTGRLMPGRRWSDGIHQAVEAKERVPIPAESKTLATITFQNYFRMYKKLSGMTGTAMTSAEEFLKVYNLEVVAIPPNRTMIKKDLPDKIYSNEKAKFRAIVDELKTRHRGSQPLLVGTRSIERNEYLGKLLDREGVPHQILNAKNHEREGAIIAQAGKLGAVTIATNMAGRGVDIVLGGNPPDKEEAKKIKELGGLHIIGTERHEARRIDNQLRGRGGRQGDPGSSQFFLSLDDEIIRIFGGENLKALLEKFNIPEDMPIENKIISRAIESAQAKVEGYNFDMREHLLEYDDVLNRQRTKIYQKRREILESKEPLDVLRNIAKSPETLKAAKKREAELRENFSNVLKLLMLRTLDFLWQEHLENMEALRDSVRLRTYGQIDPLVAYRTEGYKLFQNLFLHFEEDLLQILSRVKIVKEPESQKVIKSDTKKEKFKKAGQKKPGRNEPCPCGSGKKYKKCCYPQYG